jgi:hypothetical protein
MLFVQTPVCTKNPTSGDTKNDLCERKSYVKNIRLKLPTTPKIQSYKK